MFLAISTGAVCTADSVPGRQRGTWRTPADGNAAAAQCCSCCPRSLLLRQDTADAHGCCICPRMQPLTLTMDPSSNLDSV